MNYDEKIMQCETRKISDCNVRVFFTEKENPEVECYIINNLYEAFERRNNISNALLI